MLILCNLVVFKIRYTNTKSLPKTIANAEIAKQVIRSKCADDLNLQKEILEMMESSGATDTKKIVIRRNIISRYLLDDDTQS